MPYPLYSSPQRMLQEAQNGFGIYAMGCDGDHANTIRGGPFSGLGFIIDVEAGVKGGLSAPGSTTILMTRLVLAE